MKNQNRIISLVAATICTLATATPGFAGLSLGAKGSGSGGLNLAVPQVNVPQVSAGASVSGETQAGSGVDANTNLDANVTVNGDDASDNQDSGRSSFRAKSNARNSNDASSDPSTNRGHKKRHRAAKPPAQQQQIHDRNTGLENRVDAGAQSGGAVTVDSATSVKADADVNTDINAPVPDAGLTASQHSDTGLKTNYNQ
jgi:hypothetical protein